MESQNQVIQVLQVVDKICGKSATKIRPFFAREISAPLNVLMEKRCEGPQEFLCTLFPIEEEHRATKLTGENVDITQTFLRLV